MEIILASGSPRRKELLQYVFSDFKVIPSSAEEIYILKMANSNNL